MSTHIKDIKDIWHDVIAKFVFRDVTLSLSILLYLNRVMKPFEQNRRIFLAEVRQAFCHPERV